MTRHCFNIFTCALLLLFGGIAGAQSQPQKLNIPLSNPGQKMMLDISILSADMEVIGEDRDDVEVTFSVSGSERRIVTPSGSQPLPGGAFTLEVDEEDNFVSIDTDWRANKVDLEVRIPRLADLELSTVNDGSIVVRNIEGTLHLENTNGPITATNISGSVIAEAINEDISVSFDAIDASNAMSFNSINGDLIIGIPSSAGVQLHLDTAKGDILSDFEVEVQPTQPIVERREEDGGIAVRVKQDIVATINGGGPVIRLETLNGNIQINRSN